MTTHAHFTFEIDVDLKEAFIAAAEADNRPASDIVREFIDDYVRSHAEAESYQAFLAGKVAAARASLKAGVGHSNVDVEAKFAARRAALADRDG